MNGSRNFGGFIMRPCFRQDGGFRQPGDEQEGDDDVLRTEDMGTDW